MSENENQSNQADRREYGILGADLQVDGIQVPTIPLETLDPTGYHCPAPSSARSGKREESILQVGHRECDRRTPSRQRQLGLALL